MLSGNVPMTVRFTDKNINNPASWSWNFRDRSTSTTRNWYIDTPGQESILLI
jgi:PKD repeat protein